MYATKTFALVLAASLLVSTGTASGQTNMGTAFTYQGQLMDNDSKANGQYDFEFKLCDDPMAACQVAGTAVVDYVHDHQVDDGLFTVEIDFGGDVFNGEGRWLELGVRPGASSGADPYTTLSPRQELTPTPHALALPGLRTQQNTTSPNLIGGYSGNTVSAGVVGATIGGGGTPDLVGTPYPNSVTNDYGTIGGGVGNQAHDYATVAGGSINIASAHRATVGGGANNIASAMHSTVAGGAGNEASYMNATVGGGIFNEASGEGAVVCGGQSNTAHGTVATVAGGAQNYAGSAGACIGGGMWNQANGADATVPGGTHNHANGDFSFAAGMRAKANHCGSFVWADSNNCDHFGLDFASTGIDQFLIRADGGVGIGKNNPYEQLDVEGNIHASGTITSGSSITIDGVNDRIECPSTMEFHVGGARAFRVEPNLTSPNLIGGHSDNSVTGGIYGATVGGGGSGLLTNHVTDNFGTVGGGQSNTADAVYATVPGGDSNTAAGANSFAAGHRAKANHDGAFVWADSKNFDFASTANDQFSARATGGARFVSGLLFGVPSAGVQLASGGGSWSSISDRDAKANFKPVDGREVLGRLAKIPVQTWNYRAQDPSIRHIGPMAQDFYAAFGVGEDEKFITTIDTDGVALAAIQGLYEIVKEKEAKIEALRAQNDAQVAELKARLAALEKLVKQADAGQQGGTR